MGVRWIDHATTDPAHPDGWCIVECCSGAKRLRDALICVVPKAQQKQGQPPFRRRCKACGPTQDLMDVSA